MQDSQEEDKGVDQREEHSHRDDHRKLLEEHHDTSKEEYSTAQSCHSSAENTDAHR